MSDGRLTVFFGARLFDGVAMRDDCALVVEDGAVPRSRRRPSGRAAASRTISPAAFCRRG